MICAVEPSLKSLQETTQKKNSVTTHTRKHTCSTNLLFFCSVSPLHNHHHSNFSQVIVIKQDLMLGTRQNTRHLPYPAPTQLCRHHLILCTQHTSATGNKSQSSIQTATSSNTVQGHHDQGSSGHHLSHTHEEQHHQRAAIL